MFRQFNECEPIEAGWKAIEHVEDPRAPIARATVFCSPCQRVALADGVVALVPIDKSRAFECFIVADQAFVPADDINILGLPLLVREIRAGKTWLLKAWTQYPPARPISGCIQ